MAVVDCLLRGDDQTPLSFRAFFLLMGYGIIYLTTHLVDLVRGVINPGKRVSYPACFNFDPVIGLLGVCLFCLGTVFSKLVHFHWFDLFRFLLVMYGLFYLTLHFVIKFTALVFWLTRRNWLIRELPWVNNLVHLFEVFRIEPLHTGPVHSLRVWMASLAGATFFGAIYSSDAEGVRHRERIALEREKEKLRYEFKHEKLEVFKKAKEAELQETRRYHTALEEIKCQKSVPERSAEPTQQPGDSSDGLASPT